MLGEEGGHTDKQSNEKGDPVGYMLAMSTVLGSSIFWAGNLYPWTPPSLQSRALGVTGRVLKSISETIQSSDHHKSCF